MTPVNRSHFVENYIEPVIAHPATQLAFQLAVEVVKIVAAKMFLEYLGKRFLNKAASKMSQREVFIATVIAPIVEEIVFRGILLQGIHSMQKAWNRNHCQNPLTEEDEAAQQFFRIHLSALIFAAVHFTKPQENMRSALSLFTWSYLEGVTYGYLSEKYHTLSVSILVHGFHNSLAVAARLYPAHLIPVFILAVVANHVGAYILAIQR